MKYDKKLRESVRNTPEGLRQKVLVICAWRGGSTTKDGKFDYPDNCKLQKCKGIFHKAPDKDCFVSKLPVVESIKKKEAEKDGNK